MIRRGSYRGHTRDIIRHLKGRKLSQHFTRRKTEKECEVGYKVVPLS